jgi:predicted homoserine dehydrogenase-like protein
VAFARTAISSADFVPSRKDVVQRPIKAGSIVMWDDVVANEGTQAVRVRREMEALFRGSDPGGRTR